MTTRDHPSLLGGNANTEIHRITHDPRIIEIIR
jgi:hypothetical protein